MRIEGWARDGLTDAQIAANMGITAACLYNYQAKFVEIFDALKRGKAPVDIEVENALLKRAKGGFKVTEERIEKWKDAEGNEREHSVIIRREVPPDTTALIYWLKNRLPDKWRDKREVQAEIAGSAFKNMKSIADLINDPQPDIAIEDIIQDGDADE